MAGLNDTPNANRLHIAFFGLRNAGKSTLVNAFAGQEVAIVSEVAGTTTDPVSKAMEILPLGPCLLTDTAGLDDEGDLGELRVRRAFDVLATTDVAVWVSAAPEDSARTDDAIHARFVEECRRRDVTVLEYHRGEDVEAFRQKVSSVKRVEATKPILADLVEKGDVVLLVCPQDGSAPKGRLILPQQQVIRELLDVGCVAQVCQPDAIPALVAAGVDRRLKFGITDSQAFGAVDATLPKEVPLTSFSILFARAKGDLNVFCEGLAALKVLNDGDTVLVAEGCTHHRQCGDIGTVKLPKAVAKLTGKTLNFVFCSGGDFPLEKKFRSLEVEKLRSLEDQTSQTLQTSQTSQTSKLPKLVIHCGGCMLTRREMARRIAAAQDADVPITNYGLVLAAANGLEIDPTTCMIRRGRVEGEISSIPYKSHAEMQRAQREQEEKRF